MIKAGATIGIVGGGQLGNMLTSAAKPLGFNVIVLEPTPNSPAAQVGAHQIQAELSDPKALEELADKSDVITIEFEHLNVEALQNISDKGKSVHPSPKTIMLIQDKFKQKQFFAKRGIPVGPFQEIKDESSALKALDKFKKIIVKTRLGGFDGRGNMVVDSPIELKQALKKFAGQPLYVEKYIPFQKELAVMIVRSINGQTVGYPVVETIHIRNICVEVLAPAPISAVARARAEALANQVAQNLEGAGAFGVEMFLTKNDEVLLNEVAPRVHNSGHYSLVGTPTSQFEQHIRAISGMPLGSTELLFPATVMVNVLGERDGPTKVTGIDKASKIPGVSVLMYGKSPTRVDRKMGHIIATGKNLNEARSKARKARKEISV